MKRKKTKTEDLVAPFEVTPELPARDHAQRVPPGLHSGSHGRARIVFADGTNEDIVQPHIARCLLAKRAFKFTNRPREDLASVVHQQDPVGRPLDEVHLMP